MKRRLTGSSSCLQVPVDRFVAPQPVQQLVQHAPVRHLVPATEGYFAQAASYANVGVPLYGSMHKEVCFNTASISLYLEVVCPS